MQPTACSSRTIGRWSERCLGRQLIRFVFRPSLGEKDCVFRETGGCFGDSSDSESHAVCEMMARLALSETCSLPPLAGFPCWWEFEKVSRPLCSTAKMTKKCARSRSTRVSISNDPFSGVLADVDEDEVMGRPTTERHGWSLRSHGLCLHGHRSPKSYKARQWRLIM